MRTIGVILAILFWPVYLSIVVKLVLDAYYRAFEEHQTRQKDNRNAPETKLP